LVTYSFTDKFPMNDKRSAIAVLVCIMVILTYTQLFIQPLYDQARLQAANKDFVKQPAGNETAGNGNSAITQPVQTFEPEATLAGTTLGGGGTTAVSGGQTAGSLPTLQQVGDAPKTTFSNGDITVTLNHLGGRAQHVWLNKYKATRDSLEPLDLLEGNERSRSLPGRLIKDNESDDGVAYTLREVLGATLKGDRYEPDSDTDIPPTLVFGGTTRAGTPIEKRFQFGRSGYVVSVRGTFGSNPIPGVPIKLEWTSHTNNLNLHRRLDPFEFGYVVPGGDPSSRSYSQVIVGQLKVNEVRELPRAQWIGYGDTYFLQALSRVAGGAASFGIINDQDGAGFFWRLSGETTHLSADLYLGPKSRAVLREAGNDLWRAVDLGMFSVVAEPLTWLLNVLYSFLGNYGLAIIGLTLLVKLALYPFAKHSFDSMSKMQEIQPEMKRIQEQHKDDQARLQQEMMALYKRKGVNPMGGCLPLFLQIPVFLGLYNSLLKAIELRHEPYALWINDLSAPEYLGVMGVGIPVMILLMGASMIWQQWTTPSAVDPQQKKMMMMMPVVFAGMFIIFPMPSGLVMYWLVNNVISIVQQKYMRSHVKASPLFATLLASGGIFALGFILTLL
jgi:YidC/Oxa1 family membrane protein insertase